MQNLFLLSVLIYLALKLLYILIGLFKKSKTKDKAAIVALRDVNLSLIEAVFYFIALIIFFRIFAKWYYQVYSILIPDYLTKWYQIFDYNSLLAIKNMFFHNSRIVELHTLTTFMNLGLQGFIWSIVSLIICINFLHKGLQRKTVSNKGIYYLGQLLNWGKIMGYEWQGPIRRKYIKSDIEYYKLSLDVANSKFIKRLINQDTLEYTLLIRSVDREKVDYLIKSNNINSSNGSRVTEI